MPRAPPSASSHMTRATRSMPDASFTCSMGVSWRSARIRIGTRCRRGRGSQHLLSERVQMRPATQPRTRRRQLAAAAVLFVVCCVGARAQTPARVLSPDHAVALALDHDLELRRDRLGPQIADYDVSAAATAWTPELSSRLSAARRNAPPTSTIDPGEVLTDREVVSEVTVAQRLPWGSSYRIGWDAGRLATNSVL